jgi:hypothetical protein
VGEDGHKLTGSAQLRRAGGLLQHGAAFLKPYGVSNERFTHLLFDTVQTHYSQELAPFPMEPLQAELAALCETYCKSSGEILPSAPVTSGSHLDPASF